MKFPGSYDDDDDRTVRRRRREGRRRKEEEEVRGKGNGRSSERREMMEGKGRSVAETSNELSAINDTASKARIVPVRALEKRGEEIQNGGESKIKKFVVNNFFFYSFF